jgi:transcriptional regulator with XRE-family HTH domain
MVTKMLRDDRRRAGWSEAQVAWRVGVSVATYRRFESGEQAPTFDTYERICKLFGWPQSFVKPANVASRRATNHP